MQVLLVIVIVCAALAYLGHKAYKAFFSKKTKCEGCAFSKSAGLTEK
jgi:hypothetical protein